MSASGILSTSRYLLSTLKANQWCIRKTVENCTIQDYPNSCTADDGILDGNWEAIISSGLDFLDSTDPDGMDDQWFTTDDGLQLQDGSAGIDAGDDTALPADTYDLDEDGDIDEAIPFDIADNPRIQGNHTDIGAYESSF